MLLECLEPPWAAAAFLFSSEDLLAKQCSTESEAVKKKDDEFFAT
jgi:hypothetical protein